MNGLSAMNRTASTSSSIFAVSSAITFLSGNSVPTVMAVSSGTRAELLELLGRRKRRNDNVLIAGAAAKVAGKGNTHFLLRRVGVVAQEFDEARENAGGAVAALETVILVKGLLQRMQLVGRWRNPFN